MNLRIITKNRAADPEIGFIIKSLSQSYGLATTMPTAWELRMLKSGKFFIQKSSHFYDDL